MRVSKPIATVVVIDDDHRIRESLLHLLNARGFTVQTFSSGTEFLRSNAGESAHCVISDVMMPDMDGLELCTLLSGRNPGLPIILISGKDYKALHRSVPVDVPFLQKPLDGDEVIRALLTALTKNRQ